MFAFSAPGESPPPLQRNTRGTASDIHRDVVNTQAVVRDIRDIRNILERQEGAGSQPQSVNITRALSPAEYTLTAA